MTPNRARSAGRFPACVRRHHQCRVLCVGRNRASASKTHALSVDSVLAFAGKKSKVKLGDGKERNIQHMVCTSFWHPDGTPMSAQQFMELLFGKLPEFFKNEAELRALWSAPDTRRRLLQGLAEKGFGVEQLAEMQKIIDAEKSDIFDVLAHVAYALAPVTRAERATHARIHINTRFSAKQQAFLDFVLAHYVSRGSRGTRPGEADPPTPPQIPRLHRRRGSRPGQAPGHRRDVRGVSEISVHSIV
jgi:hypothetical protein